ncbi:MAG: hypothetical protein K1X57_11115 [Gemmataceae bacterium]|nr:hypothetical protein [Gemmataceae bacterium]
MHTPPSTPAAGVPAHSAEGEHRHHNYTTSRIPWFVHLIWISFWVVAMLYIWQHLIPSMQIEIANPP